MNSLVDNLISICGAAAVFTDPADMASYEQDQTMNLRYSFDVLVKPGSAVEVSEVLKCCNLFNVPVTPRGGGTGVTGGALAVKGGVMLSVERLNKIISINTDDQYVVSESGVVVADLCKYVEDSGFLFPVIPSSYESCFIGGNVAENAGSIHSCRYGNAAKYVLNLEVVLPTGEIIWTGANVAKNATGLDLTHLFVGSEGVLGVITKVVYKLLPLPLRDVTVMAAFDSMENACRAVLELKKMPFLPAAVELICADAINLTASYMKERFPMVEEYIVGHLLVELHGFDDDEIDRSVCRVFEILEQYASENILYAVTAEEKRKIWSLRFNIGNALTDNGSFYRDIDISIPVSFLYCYVSFLEELRQKENVSIVCFGHALDGNLHTMLQLDSRMTVSAGKIERLNEAIYRKVIENGGVISGEHGIGMLQKEFMRLQFSLHHLELFRKIKAQFDPNGIMNPGKMF